MRKLHKCLIVTLTTVVLVAAVQAGDAGEKVPLDKVPAKVLDAVKARFPKAKILSAENGDVDGIKVYEFQLQQDRRQWEVSFALDGKLIASEEVITKLPANVKAAFDKKYPDAKIAKMEKETTGEGEKAKIVFEIFVERGSDHFEIQYNADAKFLGEKKLKAATK